MGKCLKLCGIFIALIGMMNVLLYVQKHPEPVSNCEVFEGAATEEEPYIIDSYDKLRLLRDEVNKGNSFEGQYFLQTINIDMLGEEWVPIGIYGTGKYFYGIYDGGGHYVENLLISGENAMYPANGGFFGMLGGTVKNFGIESGSVKGEFVGSISSHGLDNCLILNCYNKASVTGISRAGGICDNLGSGSMVNCVSMGEVTAPISGIISYNASYIASVYPSVFPESFQGAYYSVVTEGSTASEMLNNGLNQLIDEGMLNRKDVTWWQ